MCSELQTNPFGFDVRSPEEPAEVGVLDTISWRTIGFVELSKLGVRIMHF